MKISDLFKLPPAVMGAFLLLIWPALWAAADLTVAFAGDLLRRRRHTPGASRKAA